MNKIKQGKYAISSTESKFSMFELLCTWMKSFFLCTPAQLALCLCLSTDPYLFLFLCVRKKTLKARGIYGAFLPCSSHLPSTRLVLPFFFLIFLSPNSKHVFFPFSNFPDYPSSTPWPPHDVAFRALLFTQRRTENERPSTKDRETRGWRKLVYLPRVDFYSLTRTWALSFSWSR